MIDQSRFHKMASSEEAVNRMKAAEAIGSAFSQIPNKNDAWLDLHKMAQDQDVNVREIAVKAIGSAFRYLPDKILAYEDLIRSCYDKDFNIRWTIAYTFGIAFPYFFDKAQGWKDLRRLTQDPEVLVQFIAIKTLGSVFAYILDKEQAWNDLHRFAGDPNGLIRQVAAYAIGSSFYYVPDKVQAWKDVHRLAQDPSKDIKEAAAYAVGSAFSYVSDKSQAWEDLHRLGKDPDADVRRSATWALGSSFNCVPDRYQAWSDLHLLSKDQDSGVREAAAYTLGSFFMIFHDRDQVFMDLHVLAEDRDERVRAVACHSLGRSSVLMAIEAFDKDRLCEELKSAIDYFEKSSQQGEFNPADFCLPFYRSYFAIAFESAKGEEVKRYLAEAKEAVGSSEGREELLKVVENLAGALDESQKLKNSSIEDVSRNLDAYRWYCDNAAKYMAAVKGKAPGTFKIMQRCNPFIEERIKKTIAEIKQIAERIGDVTSGCGVAYEELGIEIDKTASSLSYDNDLNNYKCSARIASIIIAFCRLLPQDKRGHACEIAKEIETEEELTDKLSKIELALTYLQPNIELATYESVSKDKLDELDRKIISVDNKLDNIIFDISRLKIGSGNTVANLRAMRDMLGRIETEQMRRETQMQESADVSLELSEKNLHLAQLLDAKVNEFEGILRERQSRDGVEEILNKLEGLRPSRTWEWVGHISDLIAIFESAIRLFTYIT